MSLYAELQDRARSPYLVTTAAINVHLLCILFELMEECKMRHVKLTRQMNGMITSIFQKVTLFLFLKDEMRLCKGRRVTLTSRILYSSMSSNRIHSNLGTCAGCKSNSRPENGRISMDEKVCLRCALEKLIACLRQAWIGRNNLSTGY